MITISQIKKAFMLLYSGILDKNISKQMWFNHYKEKDLLPCIRLYLLGYFQNNFEPEKSTSHPYSYSGEGRFDFLIGDVAVEFAVRTPECSSRKLKLCDNTDEIAKLTKYPGDAVLILFDFSKNILAASDLEQYNQLPSLGRGVKRYPLSILYYYKDNQGTFKALRKNIK
ncbi:MAG: hypothetical protein ACLQUW_03310 [Desulfobaccales bacterium]